MAFIPEHLVSSIIRCFEDLQLDELDETWVNDVILSEFSSDVECPTTIFSEDTISRLTKILEITKQWIERELDLNETSLDTSVNEDDLILWKVLSENNIDVKYLLALIFLLCKKCVKSTAVLADKLLGLTSAKVYFNLLRISGSSAYSVYNSELVKVAVDCLKFPKDSLTTKKRPPTALSRMESTSPRKRAHREHSEASSEIEDQSEELSTENADLEAEFNDRDIQQLYSCFSELLVDIIDFLQVFSVKKDDEVINHMIERLVCCTACETRHTEISFDKDATFLFNLRRRYGSSYSTTALAYKALLTICLPLQGKEELNYIIVLKNLSRNILCTQAKGHSIQTIPHRFLVVKDNALAFVCHNLDNFPETSLMATKILVQQLSARCNEKSDFRSKVARAIVVILRKFPDKDFASMIEWFERFINQQKLQDRVTGLEVLSYLLAEPERQVEEPLPDDLAPYITYSPIVGAIIDRCYDKAATVRSKAMNVLAVNLEKIICVVSGENVRRNKRADSESGASSSSSLSLDMDPDAVVETNQQPPAANKSISLPHLEKVAALLCNRTKDFKVHVRKAALQGLEHLICLNKKYLSKENLELLVDAGSDANITVKKTCVTAISGVLNKYKDSAEVQSCWLRCVLPLILDPEKTVQAKCLEVMEIQFLQNISGMELERRCAWSLLNNIASGEHYSQQRFLSRAFAIWKMEGKLKTSLRSILEREINTENSSATWLMLNFLTMNIEVKNTSYVVNYWDNYCNKPTGNPIIQQMVLQVIGNTCKHLPPDKMKSIQEKLENDVRNFLCPVELISISIETLFKIYEVQCNRQDTYQRVVSQFALETMKTSVSFLSGLVPAKYLDLELHSEDLICQHLFTLGDLAMLCPTSIPSRMFLILQSMIASPNVEDDRCSVQSGRSGRSAAVSVREKGFPPKILAVAFITLGKLCLQSEEFTKLSVPLLVCELTTSRHYVIRNNIVIVLADLCIRYTSAVDLYIPSISACLKDSSALVRHQTLALLSKLLQEDYIKMKDSLLFRMLSMITEEDKKIRNLAEYCFAHMLVKRNPSIFHQYFVDCIFYFNAHPDSRKAFSNYDQDIKLFSLCGDANRGKRMFLYKFMIINSPAPKRFAISLKLCQEILGSVADNILVLDEYGIEVVKDCLRVLSSEEIKLPTANTASGDDNEETEAAEAMAVVKAAQRVSLVQLVIPIVTSLKKILVEMKCPLLNYLMVFLRQICQDYRNELRDIFAADQQLGKEIEFDIRRYEKEIEREKQLEEETNSFHPATAAAATAAAKPRAGPLNDHNAIMLSAQKAIRLSNKISDGASCSTSNETSNGHSSLLKPMLSLKKLSPRDVRELAKSKVPSFSEIDSPMQVSESQETSDVVAEESVDLPASASENRSALSSELRRKTPVVVLHRLSAEAISRSCAPVSSTPMENRNITRFAIPPPNISDIQCSDTDSSEQSTVSRTRRTRRKRNK